MKEIRDNARQLMKGCAGFVTGSTALGMDVDAVVVSNHGAGRRSHSLFFIEQYIQVVIKSYLF